VREKSRTKKEKEKKKEEKKKRTKESGRYVFSLSKINSPHYDGHELEVCPNVVVVQGKWHRLHVIQEEGEVIVQEKLAHFSIFLNEGAGEWISLQPGVV